MKLNKLKSGIMSSKVLLIERLFLVIILNTCSDYLLLKSSHVNGQITCDPACQRGIDDAYNYAASIHKELTEANDNLLQRVLKLENEEIGVISEINSLNMRISTVEATLKSNVSNLQRTIQDEIGILWRDTTTIVQNLEADLRDRLDKLTSVVNGHHGNGNGDSVFQNLSRRIDSLEYGKVYNLSVDNQIWRRNFRVINSTFARIKSNNCVC